MRRGAEGKNSGSPFLEGLKTIDFRKKFLDLFGWKGAPSHGRLDSSFVDRLSPDSQNGPASMALDLADEFVCISIFPFQNDRVAGCPDGFDGMGGEKKTLIEDGGEPRKQDEPESAEEKVKPEGRGLMMGDITKGENAGKHESRSMEESARECAFRVRSQGILFVYHGWRK